MPNEHKSKKNAKKLDGCTYKPIPTASKEEMIQKARSLSFNQRIVFDKRITFAKSVVSAEKANDPLSDLPPPLMIVHGGGGVGKSYLIKATAQWIDKILREATNTGCTIPILDNLSGLK